MVRTCLTVTVLDVAELDELVLPWPGQEESNKLKLLGFLGLCYYG